MEPPPDFTDQFNTKLNPEQEKQFQKWAADNSNDNRNVIRDTFDYDMRGYWTKNSGPLDAEHLVDTFKKPNHPAFSTESKYSGTTVDGVKYVGGKWDDLGKGSWAFQPSKQMLTNTHSPQFLMEYFKSTPGEEKTKLILPKESVPDFKSQEAKKTNLMERFLTKPSYSFPGMKTFP